jgi:hypothetical protein
MASYVIGRYYHSDPEESLLDALGDRNQVIPRHRKRFSAGDSLLRFLHWAVDSRSYPQEIAEDYMILISMLGEDLETVLQMNREKLLKRYGGVLKFNNAYHFQPKCAGEVK